MLQWTVVIPVKAAVVGKSRLGRTPEVSRAIALDTIAAAADAQVRVLVVTADSDIAADATRLGAHIVSEPLLSGLAAAIEAGVATASPAGPCAVLLGDLPFLRPEDLVHALDLAAAHERAFVPDAEGTGTTLVTAAAGREFVSAFGEDSAARHRALGLTELDLPADSPLRRDVDVDAHLRGRGLGPRTTASLSA